MSCDTPIKVAAELLGVSDETVRKWAHSGVIRSERVGPKLLRVDISSLKREAVGP